MKDNNIQFKVKEYLKKESIFRIGLVHSVKGTKVEVKVFKDKNHPYITYNGEVSKGVAVGNYIKIEKGLTTLIGKIEGEYTEEENYYNKEYNTEKTKVSRFINISLLGHYQDGKFEKGIKEMPLINNECYILEREDFNRLHNFYKKEEDAVQIGQLGEDVSYPLKVDINELFANHIGIFGNTGSGKSNTLTRIYTELFDLKNDLKNFNNSKFVFIDFNGEYIKPEVLTREKTILNLNTRKKLDDINKDNKYPISSSRLENIEVLSVLLEATEKTQKPFLSRAINSDFLKDHSNFKSAAEKILKAITKNEDSSIDKKKILSEFLNYLSSFVENVQIINSLEDKLANNLYQTPNGALVWSPNDGGSDEYDSEYNIYSQEIENVVNSLNFKNDNLVDLLQLRILLRYYYELIVYNLNSEHVGPLINRMRKKFRMLRKLVRFEDGQNFDEIKNVLVVSLRNVNLEMKKILPLIICKDVYEFQKSQHDKKVKSSLHIIIDEAHNILSEQSDRESETWKDYRLETFEEIIKEGRKFGSFLTVVSQRPYDVSHTIISQLHNYFVHRLINNKDIKAIRRAVAYLDKNSFESIPILSVGNCFFSGLATNIPVKVKINLLSEEKQPESQTINLTEEVWS